jgi:putative membrane protein
VPDQGFALLAATPGFLGTRASLMLDVVFLAMFLVLPMLAGSIYLVKVKRRFILHKKIQLTLGAILLGAVTAFEIDMRFFTDWEALAAASPYYQAEGWSTVWIALVVHLFFAIPTTFIWIYVIVQALRKYPPLPVPGPHSAAHKLWGWIATIEMFMTAITGWTFYYLAFVAGAV